uniref:Voltage-dependent calcium channel gamma-3 subunit n=1 Tax=Eptatretus burgeri TaxID=7764 RepID=A0A8C4QKY8_EPTBU
MAMCDSGGGRSMLTTVGAFAAFSLMTIAVGTDYWLYARGVCRPRQYPDNETARRLEEVMTHSGLWRTCCLEGAFKGTCRRIEHFPEENDYDKDTSEYILRVMRSLSIFPILSVSLLFCGGLCIAASEFYRSKHNIILGAGIFFVAAGLANVIGIIIYISSNTGDPGKSDAKKSNYSYGWSFYFGALAFIIAEAIGVVIVHTYIDTLRQARTISHLHFFKKPGPPMLPQGYHLRARRRSSGSSGRSRDGDASPVPFKPFGAGHSSADISLYTLTGMDPGVGVGVPGSVPGSAGASFDCERESAAGGAFLHNCFSTELKETLFGTNRRTTPV